MGQPVNSVFKTFAARHHPSHSVRNRERKGPMTLLNTQQQVCLRYRIMPRVWLDVLNFIINETLILPLMSVSTSSSFMTFLCRTFHRETRLLRTHLGKLCRCCRILYRWCVVWKHHVIREGAVCTWVVPRQRRVILIRVWAEVGVLCCCGYLPTAEQVRWYCVLYLHLQENQT